jgi:hypothetical protein
METLRHLDDADLTGAGIDGPDENVGEALPIRGGIPLDQNQLGTQPVPLTLLDETVCEGLHPAAKIEAVIVVPRGGHDG